jgi:FkbH-like protein
MTEPMLWQMTLADAVSAALIPSSKKRFRVLVLRQFTVEPLASFLTVGGRSLGLEIEVRFGNFDTMMQDALSDMLWIDPPDVIVVAPLPSRFSPELVDNFHSLSDEQMGRSVAEAEANAKNLIRAIRIQSNRPILWFGIYLMSGGLSLGLADQRLGERSQARTVAEVNKKIDDLLNDYGPGWLVDIERCKSRVGEDRFTDPIRSFTTATPFTSTAFREIAVECLKYLRSITGTQKKVLALDCDNTLWGGLAGEVGYEGVNLDPQGFPSGAHLQLQRVAASLCARGVLIVLVSKNEPSNVWNVFEHRPEMVLRRINIAAARINWERKSENLISLSKELNLGLESFVFVDDQLAEIEVVRRFCPEVEALQLTEATLKDFSRIVSSAGWFESTTITDVDRSRTHTYQSNLARDIVRSGAVSLDSYLCELEMELNLFIDDKVDIGRAAQMCQRTNQFNLTNRRHTPSDIEKFVKSSDACVVSLSVKDKFGALGAIALLILQYDADTAYIDTMLLSCRAFGRFCEHALLAEAISRANRRGVRQIIGEYIPTSRNQIVSNFWQQNGFVASSNGEGTQRYTLELPGNIKSVPDVFKLIEVEE